MENIQLSGGTWTVLSVIGVGLMVLLVHALNKFIKTITKYKEATAAPAEPAAAMIAGSEIKDLFAGAIASLTAAVNVKTQIGEVKANQKDVMKDLAEIKEDNKEAHKDNRETHKQIFDLIRDHEIRFGSQKSGG